MTVTRIVGRGVALFVGACVVVVALFGSLAQFLLAWVLYAVLYMWAGWYQRQREGKVRDGDS